MKPTVYSLIVVAPEGAGRIRKIHVSRLAVLILLAAFVLSFFATVTLMMAFPRQKHVDEANYSRLVAENQALRVENINATLRLQKVKTQVSHVEELSAHIESILAELH
jgi:hypothetical protein